MKSMVIVLAALISFNVFAQEEMGLDKNSKLYKEANAQRLLATETAQLLETIAANKSLQQKRKKLESDSLDSIDMKSPVATAEMTLNMIQSRLRDSDDSQYVLELSQQACMNLGTLKANGSVIKGDALIDHAARFCTLNRDNRISLGETIDTLSTISHKALLTMRGYEPAPIKASELEKNGYTPTGKVSAKTAQEKTTTKRVGGSN